MVFRIAGFSYKRKPHLKVTKQVIIPLLRCSFSKYVFNRFRSDRMTRINELKQISWSIRSSKIMAHQAYIPNNRSNPDHPTYYNHRRL